MVKEANQSGYWNCQVIAIAFMHRLLKYSNQRNSILAGQVVNQDAGKSIEAETSIHNIRSHLSRSESHVYTAVSQCDTLDVIIHKCGMHVFTLSIQKWH